MQPHKIALVQLLLKIPPLAVMYGTNCQPVPTFSSDRIQQTLTGIVGSSTVINKLTVFTSSQCNAQSPRHFFTDGSYCWSKPAEKVEQL